MKKWKQGFKGKTSSYDGLVGGSKLPNQGQYALAAPTTFIWSSTSAPKHKLEFKGGYFLAYHGSTTKKK